MMVVVADTSPVNYLVLIGEIGILAQLYQRVVIPREVFVELMDEDAPLEVRNGQSRVPAGSRFETRRLRTLGSWNSIQGRRPRLR
jgi:hypothetical protein